MRFRIGAKLVGIALVCLASLSTSIAYAAESRQFSFAYDQPTTTAYGIAANIFDAKLKELSGGTMSINQFPGAQLGQEPQMLQKLRAGDIDFVITSTANASTLAPQAGVFSLHFIFRDQNHLAKALQLEKDSAEKLKKMGVKVVENVDKTGFAKDAAPIQDQLAKELGPHAVKILGLVRGIK